MSRLTTTLFMLDLAMMINLQYSSAMQRIIFHPGSGMRRLGAPILSSSLTPSVLGVFTVLHHGKGTRPVIEGVALALCRNSFVRTPLAMLLGGV
jgi:hypothetical protein